MSFLSRKITPKTIHKKTKTHTVIHNIFFPIFVFLNIYFSPAHGEQPLPTSELKYSKYTYTYKTVGNLEIKADVYSIPEAGYRPAIMYIHGGALIFGSRNDAPPKYQLERYLKAGYSVVSIDYRLAPETKLPAIIEDVEDAYSWVRERGQDLLGIDPNRIAVMGMSAGGYLALMAGFKLNPRPRAVVSFYGYGDITGPWYSQPSPFYSQQPIISRDEAFEHVMGPAISESTSVDHEQTEHRISASTPITKAQGRGAFYLYCRQNGLWPKEVSGHDPENEQAWFVGYEPRSNVSPFYPPTMLLHGEKDTDVPFEQSVLMADALKLNGVEHEFVSQPDWEHAFDFFPTEEHPKINVAIGRVIDFLDKHVK